MITKFSTCLLFLALLLNSCQQRNQPTSPQYEPEYNSSTTPALIDIEKALDHPLYNLLHDEPNPEMSSFVFRETLMTHLLLWGNAYAQIIRNGKGEVVALYPLMPNRMEVNRDKNGKLYYLYSTQSDDAPTMKG